MVKLYEPDYQTFDGVAPLVLCEDTRPILRDRIVTRQGPYWTELVMVGYGELESGLLFRVVDIFEGYGRGMSVAWRRKTRNRLMRLLEI